MKRVLLLLFAVFSFALQGHAQYAYWQGVSGTCVGSFDVASNWQAVFRALICGLVSRTRTA